MNLVNRIYVFSAMRRMIIAAAISCRGYAEQQSTGVWSLLFAGRQDQPIETLTDFARSNHWHQTTRHDYNYHRLL